MGVIGTRDVGPQGPVRVLRDALPLPPIANSFHFHSTTRRNKNLQFWGKQECSYFSICYLTQELGPSPRSSEPVRCRLT